MDSEIYDFIIVGGGLAGLVLAARLSENPQIQVLVVEAGHDQSQDPRVTVPGLWSTLQGTESDWQFVTVPQEGLRNRRMKTPQGRLLGGSAALNGVGFAPPSKACVDAWAGLGNQGWDWPTFSRSLFRSFRFDSPSSSSAAAAIQGDGPIRLTVPDDDAQWKQVWSQTLAEHGIATGDAADLFSGHFCGALVAPDTVDSTTKQRSFPANTYLTEAAQSARQNLTIWTQTPVNKILFSAKSSADGDVTATGVEVTRDGRVLSVAARKEVLLTAGTLNSPRLLELSGVGDAERLSSMGIHVVVNNPYVGENLQNHPMFAVNYEIVEREGFATIDQLARQDPAAVAAAMEAYSKQQGPLAKGGANLAAQLPVLANVSDQGLAAAAFDLGGGKQEQRGNATAAFAEAHESYVRSASSSRNEASGVFFFAAGFSSSSDDGTMIPPPPGTEKYITIVSLLSHPLSRGSTHITSKDGSVAVDPRYFSHPADLEAHARHLQFAETLVATEPLAGFVKPGGKRGPKAPEAGGFAHLDRAKDYLRDMAIGAYHFTGTCTMMPREMGGVVDRQLRLYGCKNLRVCDASVVPFVPQANTQATVYGIAERAAEIIKADL